MDMAAAVDITKHLHQMLGHEPDPTPETAQQFYMVICRTNQEFDTVDSFRRNGLSAWWPNYEELVVTRRRLNGHPMRRIRRCGIVPGYVFSPVVAGAGFTQILQRIVGAIDLAKTFSGNPLLLERGDIAILERIEADKNTPRPEQAPRVHDFKLGEKVRFVDDLRHSWPPGRIQRLAKNGRISVEVALMGRKVEIKVLPHQIERS